MNTRIQSEKKHRKLTDVSSIHKYCNKKLKNLGATMKIIEKRLSNLTINNNIGKITNEKGSCLIEDQSFFKESFQKNVSE